MRIDEKYLRSIQLREVMILDRILRDRIYADNLTISKIIDYVLLRLHCPSTLLGYNYIKIGIELAILDPSIMLNALNSLYKDIASISNAMTGGNTKWTAVEHAMRTAVSKIWKKNKSPDNRNEILCLLFGDNYIYEKEPKNTDLVAMLADYIRLVYVVNN